MPVDAVSLIFRTPAVSRGRGGAVALYSVPVSTLRYDVDLADQPALDALSPPDPSDKRDATLDRRAVTPRIATLAAELMGQGSERQRAISLEYHLSHDYGYTTEFIGRSGQLA